MEEAIFAGVGTLLDRLGLVFMYEIDEIVAELVRGSQEAAPRFETQRSSTAPPGDDVRRDRDTCVDRPDPLGFRGRELVVVTQGISDPRLLHAPGKVTVVGIADDEIPAPNRGMLTSSYTPSGGSGPIR